MNHQALIELSADYITFQSQSQAFYIYILHMKRDAMPWLIYVYEKKIIHFERHNYNILW